MPRLAVAPDYRLLLDVLGDPIRLKAFSPQQLSRLLDVAEHARLLGWLLQHAVVPGRDAPSWLSDRFESARRAAAEYDRTARWEIERLQRAFTGSEIRWVVLKGGGYLAASLPPGQGRRVADLDILVAESDLEGAEHLLHERGWDFAKLDPYDERFYREWMHELPPLVHRERNSVIDLHHAILPRTSRLRPSTERLLQRSIEVPSGVRVLCPSHMVLHAAVHLFHDGEIAGAIRDLVDLDGLLRLYCRTQTFVDDFIGEAQLLGIMRPAFYALRYTNRLLHTPLPPDLVRGASRWAPPAPVRGLMDALVERTLQGQAFGSETSALALYIRSHWLRMPPMLLGRHLFRKAFRSP
jgi:hypothetical protein